MRSVKFDFVRGRVGGWLACLLATGWIAWLSPMQAAPEPPSQESSAITAPTAGQVEFQQMGFGLFVHWSPSVYQGTEGDNLKTPKHQINPDRFDAAQIVQAAQSCGAGYVVFVAKHVGGYCAWQTQTTDYSLKTSPWKHGKGDMEGELASACRKAGLKFGVYLCPRDDYQKIGNGGKAATAAQQPAADALYRQQLTELLTHYGALFEVWFDGGNGIPVNDLLDKYAPEVVTFQGRRHGSSRWVGTEHGHAPYPCWNTVQWKSGDIPQWGAGTKDGNLWAPAECDVSILRPNWFWSSGSDARVLSVGDLTEIYYLSVGRSANLLLNITPDDHGAIPDAQIKRLAEFGEDIRARFGKPLAVTSAVLKNRVGKLEMKFDRETKVNHVRLCEDIRGGERVRAFRLTGTTSAGKTITLASGSQIGARQIIPFAPAVVKQVTLEIGESVASPSIKEFSVFHVDRSVPALAYREGGRVAMRAPILSRTSDGTFSLDCPSPDWDTHYTLDGSEPTRDSPIYHEPQRSLTGGVLKARFIERDDASAALGSILNCHMGLAAAEMHVVRVSSEDDEGKAASALDANPKTMWHTAWRPQAVRVPHELILDLGQSRQVVGLACLPRQDANGNQPSRVQVTGSDRVDQFPDHVQCEGKFGDYQKSPRARHEMLLSEVVAGRYIKIVFPDVATNGPCLAMAELEVLLK